MFEFGLYIARLIVEALLAGGAHPPPAPKGELIYTEGGLRINMRINYSDKLLG